MRCQWRLTFVCRCDLVVYLRKMRYLVFLWCRSWYQRLGQQGGAVEHLAASIRQRNGCGLGRTSRRRNLWRSGNRAEHILGVLELSTGKYVQDIQSRHASSLLHTICRPSFDRVFCYSSKYKAIWIPVYKWPDSVIQRLSAWKLNSNVPESSTEIELSLLKTSLVASNVLVPIQLLRRFMYRPPIVPPAISSV